MSDEIKSQEFFFPLKSKIVLLCLLLALIV